MRALWGDVLNNPTCKYVFRTVKKRPPINPRNPEVQKALFKALDESGLAYHRVAKKAGVSPSFLYRTRRDGHSMSSALLQALADTLGYEIHFVKVRRAKLNRNENQKGNPIPRKAGFNPQKSTATE